MCAAVAVKRFHDRGSKQAQHRDGTLVEGCIKVCTCQQPCVMRIKAQTDTLRGDDGDG